MALLFLVVALLYLPRGLAQFVAFLLLLLVFVSDALDGYIARKSSVRLIHRGREREPLALRTRTRAVLDSSCRAGIG